MDITFVVPLIFLSILSIIDLLTFNKEKGYIPSFMTSLFLIVAFFVKQDIALAIMSALLGIFLSDFGIWKGIADYKVYVAVAMTMTNLVNVLLFTSEMLIIAGIASLIMKAKGKKEMPYIPVIMLAWFVSLILTF